ncbi:MAG: hypothetical protein H7235_01545 [Bdellovibrionaceae bacterium]|nr:hypothetical protein [Pseudobdellovibrionaceae bacterium]
MKHNILILILILILFSLLLVAQIQAAPTAKFTQRRFGNQTENYKIMTEITGRLSLKSTTPDPNYFQKLRMELNTLAEQERKSAKSQGVLMHSLLKLPVDTFGFFVATGAVNFMSMWNHAGGNPLLFQEQVLNLKDPMATLSFYAFIAANGAYLNFRMGALSQKMSPEIQALVMRRITYQAMAAGSFASSVIGDIGNSIKSCANSWLPKGQYRSVLDTTKNADEAKSDQICNEANEIWTAKNITKKYVPQIFSLLAVQAATEVIQGTAKTATSWSANTLYKALVAGGKKAGLEMLFINIALSASPSRLVVRSFSIVGKITQFAFFVGVDHAINNTLTRGFNNMFKPLIFGYSDQFSLDKYFEVGGKYNWDDSKIVQLKQLFDPTGRADKKSAIGEYSFDKFKTAFPEEIKNFSAQLTDWRNHLNSDADAELTSWMGMTTRIINQLQLSESYYRNYITNLFLTSSRANRINLPEEHPDHVDALNAYNNSTIYPYRTLPLFGVRYIPWADSNVKEENAYLSFPNDTEKMQSRYLKQVAYSIQNENKVQEYHLPKAALELVSGTLEALRNGNTTVQGQALQKFMDEYKKSLVNNNVELRLFGKYLTELIGHPNPRLYEGEGFNAAFEQENKNQMDIADFDLVDSHLNINLKDGSQYLTHAMLCGPARGEIKQFTSFDDVIKWWEPDFYPPRIVNSSAKEFCHENGGKAHSDKFYNVELTNSETKQKFKNVTTYIVQNIKHQVLGDYRDKEKMADFTAWWHSEVMVTIPAVLEKWDQGYAEIVEKAMGNIFDRKSFSSFAIDRYTQFNWFNDNLLASNLIDSYRFEKEFYLQTINMVRSKMNFNLPAHGDTSILSEAKKVALGEKSKILSKLVSKEYVNVSLILEELLTELSKPVDMLSYTDQIKSDELLKAMPAFAGQLDYKKYLDLAEKFEDSISEIELAAGLKVVSNKEGSVFDKFPAASASTTKTEKTKVYEDAKITPDFTQSVVAAATAGLRNIEVSISKYARMKILMKRGLRFTKEELKKFNEAGHDKACALTTRGCQ